MRFLILFISLALMIIIIDLHADAKKLRANAARVDLTPPLDLNFALGGYGARMSEPAQGIHDRIWVKALILSDGDKKFAIVTLDILALPPNIKPQVLKKLAESGWADANILLLPSHSHTSLDMTALNDKNTLNNPYLGIYQPSLKEFVVNSIIKVIKLADTNLKPIQVGTDRSTVMGMNRNRRNEEATDQDLTVTRIDLLNGQPLALLINWTAHPTIMDENDMLVSGGWPGYLQRELEEWIGNDVLCMFYNGAEGDQSPIRPNGASHYEQAEIYGRKMAKQVYELYQEIKPEIMIPFSYNTTLVNLPQPQAHPMFHTTGGSEYGIDEAGMKIILSVMCPAQTALEAVKIGDLLIVAAPGELTSTLGLKVKNKLSQLGVKYPVIGGLADEWISYIVSTEQYNKGGYETSVSFYGPDLGNTIVQAMLEAAMPLAE
jgi:neutral ceramidase